MLFNMRVPFGNRQPVPLQPLRAAPVGHRRGQPVRGQRTHTNARTRKGKAVAIAGKKKVTK